MTNDEQRTVRDEQAMNTAEQTSSSDEQLRTDGGADRCVRCGTGNRTGEIGTFPAVPPADGTDDLCLSCFGERVAAESPLSEAQGVVLGAEHIGHPIHTITEFVAYPKSGVRDLRATAADAIAAPDFPRPAREMIDQLDVALPTRPEQ